MRSYKLKNNDLIECSIYIDTRGSRIRVLQDADLYKKATGKSDSVAGLIDTKQPLPDGVIKETANFARMSFAVQQEIDQQTIEYTAEDKVRIDSVKRDQLRIRHLLRDWSLKEDEKPIALYKVNAGNRTSLRDDSYNMVMNEIEPAIIQGFLICLDLQERAAAESISAQATKELAEGTGIKAKN